MEEKTKMSTRVGVSIFSEWKEASLKFNNFLAASHPTSVPIRQMLVQGSAKLDLDQWDWCLSLIDETEKVWVSITKLNMSSSLIDEIEINTENVLRLNYKTETEKMRVSKTRMRQKMV